MSLLEIEDKIRKQPGISKAVKGLAVMLLGAAAISGAFAQYQNYQEKTTQSIADCVQHSIANGREAAIQYSENGAAVFSQALAENMKPVAEKLQSENSFDSNYTRMNTGGYGGVLTKEDRAIIAQKNKDKAQFNLTNISESTTNALTNACKDSSFREQIEINTEKLSNASADANAGMSNKDIDSKHYNKSGAFPEMLKIDKDAIKLAKENGQTPDIQVKVRLFR